MAEKTALIERAIALRAFSALCPSHCGTFDMPNLMDEVERLGNEGLDRFGIVHRLLEARGIAPDTRLAGRYMATLQRRHAEARTRTEKASPRDDAKPFPYDRAHAEEIALNNAIAAMVEDAEFGLVEILQMAGMPVDAAEALLGLRPGERRSYDSGCEDEDAYAKLVALGLASDISNQFRGGTLGVELSAAGRIIWHLVMGIRP